MPGDIRSKASATPGWLKTRTSAPELGPPVGSPAGCEDVIDATLKIKPELSLKQAAPGLRVDLAEGPCVDVQVRVARCGVIERVGCVDPYGQILGFGNAHALLQVRIERPTARPFNRPKPERPELSRSRIAQHDVPVGVRERRIRAESREG